MDLRPVVLDRGSPDPVVEHVARRALAALSRDEAPSLEAAESLAEDIATDLPKPMRGETRRLWESLATLGAADLTLARVAEPHLDALAILDEARRDGQVDDALWDEYADSWTKGGLWQVYAAEGAERLRATSTAHGWQLTGPKAWCSLADRASHALVTAWIDEERRGMFAVDLGQQGVQPATTGTLAGQSTRWASRGLTSIRSTGLSFEGASAVAVGDPGWYLTRPGFAWGGAGVAAIWFGAAVALGRRLVSSARQREPDQIALLQVGAVDAALTRARAVLVTAADVADDPDTSSGESVHVAATVRQVVADSAEEILQRVGHALGPAPLTGEEEHARRVADLTVYLRQHHAERDLVAAGRRVLSGAGGWCWS